MLFKRELKLAEPMNNSKTYIITFFYYRALNTMRKQGQNITHIKSGKSLLSHVTKHILIKRLSFSSLGK